MPTLTEIREIKEYYVEDLHSTLRGEQALDKSYIDDTFAVPEIRSPHIVFRSGDADKIVSSAAEQLVTSKPQAFVYSYKKGDSKSADKLAKEFNQTWITAMRRQSPNVFKELIKNDIGRGESFIRLTHNESWVTGKKERFGLPVLFSVPDPMVIYASPAEDDCGWLPKIGIPNRVIVSYPRQPAEVKRKYPGWTNPEGKPVNNNAKVAKQMVDWWEYWDKDVRYFEADGQPVLQGSIQPNDYGFTPFIHKYSGFGKESPEGEIADLAVSDIRRSRDLIREICILGSDIASILHLFAHKPVTLILPADSEINESSLRKELDLGSYALNLLYLPEGSEVHWGDTIVPGPEMFVHYQNKRAELFQRYPFLSAGYPMGSSGRQQDLSFIAGRQRYESIIENTQDQVATALEMAVAITKKIPKLRPESFSKDDLEIDFKCEVFLRSDDPIEQDRKATLGRTLQEMGHIDQMTNLTEYQGYTVERAQEIMNRRAVDDVIMNDPIIRRLIAIQTAREMGMENEYLDLEQQLGAMEKGLSTVPAYQSKGGEPRRGNIKTPTGWEQSDMSLYQRGQRGAASE